MHTFYISLPADFKYYEWKRDRHGEEDYGSNALKRMTGALKVSFLYFDSTIEKEQIDVYKITIGNKEDELFFFLRLGSNAKKMSEEELKTS